MSVRHRSQDDTGSSKRGNDVNAPPGTTQLKSELRAIQSTTSWRFRRPICFPSARRRSQVAGSSAAAPSFSPNTSFTMTPYRWSAKARSRNSLSRLPTQPRRRPHMPSVLVRLLVTMPRS